MPDVTHLDPQDVDSHLPLRLLIIDDEAAIRESLQLLLEIEGFEVGTAPDGVDFKTLDLQKELQRFADCCFVVDDEQAKR